MFAKRPLFSRNLLDMADVAITNGHYMNGNTDYEMADVNPVGAVRFTSGLILPPPEIKCELFRIYFSCPTTDTTSKFKAVIDRTALFVARSANPPQFEERVREGQRSDPKFSFLNPADPYHGYYRHKMEKVAQGELEDDTPKDVKDNEVAEPKEPVDLGLEPPLPEFIMDLPNISVIDLCVYLLCLLTVLTKVIYLLQ